MQFPQSPKQKIVIVSVTFVLLTALGLAASRWRQPTPLSAADQKYRQVIERCIREGKREFSADTAVRVQIIIQASAQAGFAVSTEKLDQGARVYLKRP